jgi:hypothetical protein
MRLLACLFFVHSAFAQIPPPPNPEEVLSDAYTGKSYSPYAGRQTTLMPLWGDTHLHTANSFDAGAFGNRLGLDEAYRFARGEEITASSGFRAKLSRPLDWLVVADHSDNMGFFPDLLAGAPHILSEPKGREYYDRIKSGDGVAVALELIGAFSQGAFPRELEYAPDSTAYKDKWLETVDAAERYNEPGRFTAFIGYEWTSLIAGNNLHRVVIYRDGGDKGSQMVPYTTFPPLGSPNPRDLWKWLTNYEQKTGGDVLAIAHNGNLANGIMFPVREQYDGKRLDKTYVQQRALWESLYEVTQIKGDGETHPYLSPNDEFADYESWDKGNLDLSAAKTDDMLAGEYAREALKRGRGAPGHQPLQIRHGRFDRQPYVARDGTGRQLLRQTHGRRTEPASPEQPGHEDRTRRHHGLGTGCLGSRRGMGDGEHAPGDFRRHGAQGDLRHDRQPADGAFLRRLGLHGRRPQ